MSGCISNVIDFFAEFECPYGPMDDLGPSDVDGQVSGGASVSAIFGSSPVNVPSSTQICLRPSGYYSEVTVLIILLKVYGDVSCVTFKLQGSFSDIEHKASSNLCMISCQLHTFALDGPCSVVCRESNMLVGKMIQE